MWRANHLFPNVPNNIVLAAAILIGVITPLYSQQPLVERPKSSIFLRPYEPPRVAPSRLTNTDRLHAMIQAGKLYLTLEDTIALAIENNLDLEIDRYGPLVAQWELERAKAGGPLKGVNSGNSFVNQVTSGQGVLGAELSAGLFNQGGSSGGPNNNSVISQIGPITPNLDPVFQSSMAWSHKTTPQPNEIISKTGTLIDSAHNYANFLQQGFLTGGYVQVAFNESYLKENAPTDALNPSFAPVSQLYFRHSLLNGFGIAVNGRFIHAAEKQLSASRETFRSDLLNLVANTVNAYSDLVTDQEDVRAKTRALETAQKFYEDTGKEIALGVVARFELFPAQAELSRRKQELAISTANERQQELVLKNLISRDGLQDPLLDEADLIALGRIESPETDNLAPLRELVSTALTHRPDIAAAKVNNEAREISAIGTKNGLLPMLQGVLSTTNHAESGTLNPASGLIPPPNSVGGLGNALGQIFRHDYTDRRAALYLSPAYIGNHTAQGDYGIDQLQLKQGDLIERRNLNQLVVDISNQMVALRQARARYSNAANTLALEQELLEKEQQKFALGGSTVNDVVAAQRALAEAQSTQIAALGAYSRARVALDQVLGLTLETNHVSVAANTNH